MENEDEKTAQNPPQAAPTPADSTTPAPVARYTNPNRHPVTGHFLPGHSIRPPQNPLASKVQTLRQALINSISADTVHDVVARLIDTALNDRSGRTRVAATELFLKYSVGNPVQNVALDLTTDKQAAPLVELTPEELAVMRGLHERMSNPPRTHDV